MEDIPGLNPRQNAAAKMILAEAYPISLVSGSPGTGKTHALTLIVSELIKRIPKRREAEQPGKILICAPTNAATDEFGEKLIQLHDEGPSLNLARICSKQRWREAFRAMGITEEKLQELEERAAEEGGGKDPVFIMGTVDWSEKPGEAKTRPKTLIDYIGSMPHLGMSDVIVCTNNMAYLMMPYCISNLGGFWYLFADESGREGMSMGFLLLTICDHLVASGDIFQLEPYVPQQLQFMTNALNLDVSLLQLFRDLGHPMVQLTDNYRSTEHVIQPVNQWLYHGAMKAVNHEKLLKTAKETPVFGQMFPQGSGTCVVPVDGVEEQAPGSSSYFNFPEAYNSVMLALSLPEEHRKDKVFIITPYGAQEEVIKRILKRLQDKNNDGKPYDWIEVRSVDRFQGRECGWAIITPARCQLGKLYGDLDFVIGFTAQVHRLNVSLTRAKYGNFLVLTPRMYSRHLLWREVLTHSALAGPWSTFASQHAELERMMYLQGWGASRAARNPGSLRRGLNTSPPSWLPAFS